LYVGFFTSGRKDAISYYLLSRVSTWITWLGLGDAALYYSLFHPSNAASVSAQEFRSIVVLAALLVLGPEMTDPLLLKDSSSVLCGLSVTGVENHNFFANPALCANR
jgi:hypothetical protein